jgi:hypothetical protein
MVWYDMIYDMIWCDVIQYNTLQYNTIQYLQFVLHSEYTASVATKNRLILHIIVAVFSEIHIEQLTALCGHNV